MRQIRIGDDCWEWTGYLNAGGYAFATIRRRQWLVHRYVYEQMIGPVPQGLTLDHLCRVRRCVNPKHLEPVTLAENTRRGRSGQFQLSKTHCPQGHPYSGENLSYYSNGARRCLACLRASNKKRKQKGIAA